VWAPYLLSGGKVTGARRKIAATGELRAWIAQESATPDWLVDASHAHVGELTEMLALLLGDPGAPQPDIGLAEWIEQRLLPVANKDQALRRAVVVDAWRALPYGQRLVFNKLLTGSLRVGVSQRLVQQALAEMSDIDIARIAQRMPGTWTPSVEFLQERTGRALLAALLDAHDDPRIVISQQMQAAAGR
jgi:DNA ligase-1